MSCHCCACDHSSTIRQYFSNINLWSNSKVTQLDRQGDNCACYHSYGDGSVIKEQCMLCGAVHGSETCSFSFFSQYQLLKKTPPISLRSVHLVNVLNRFCRADAWTRRPLRRSGQRKSWVSPLLQRSVTGLCASWIQELQTQSGHGCGLKADRWILCIEQSPLFV